WTLRAAQTAMDTAKATLDTGNKTLQNALDIKNNPQQINAAVDSAHSAYDSAVSALSVAESAVTVAQKQAVVAQRQAGVAQKQVDQANAALNVVKVQLSRTSLSSPVAGVVRSRNAEVGEVAQPGAPILIVTQLDKVTLTAYVPERLIGLVKLGENVQVSVDSYPNETFSGQVTFISPQAIFTPGNVQLKDEREKTVFAVKVSLANPDHKLKPGMPADALIVTNP
ncbi:MAG: efflux RND transporter periplasmic adaptor subunit, partial [Dehalococcoidales bacterium]|nr:efflux RND transporter periplasmic adaptor subunit [Dehalococcoidales bacterium]